MRKGKAATRLTVIKTRETIEKGQIVCEDPKDPNFVEGLNFDKAVKERLINVFSTRNPPKKKNSGGV